MNLHSAENLINPIEAEDTEQHREKLEKEISKIQLFYADQVYQDSKSAWEKNPDKTAEPKDFSRILAEIKSNINRTLSQVINTDGNFSLSEKEYDGILNQYLGRIDEIYDSLDAPDAEKAANPDEFGEYFREREKQLEPVFDYINLLKMKSQQKFPERWEAREKEMQEYRESHRAGALEYNLLKGNGFHRLDKEKIEAELAGEGFSKHDDFLELQLPDFYSQQKSLGPQIIKESLAKVAEAIVDKYPQVQGVTAFSWLLDHPAVKRMIDFKILGEYGFNWLQMTDKKGQVDADRLRELTIKRGLPFKNLFGLIKTDDFLQKYLSPERRGEVTLQDINPEWVENYGDFQENIQAESRRFRTEWQNGNISDKASLIGALNALPAFQSFLRGCGEYENILAIFDKNYGRGVDEINRENAAYFKDFDEKGKAYFAKIDQDKYIAKKIYIK